MHCGPWKKLSPTSYSPTRGNYGARLVATSRSQPAHSVFVSTQFGVRPHGAKRIDVSPFVQQLCQLWWGGTKSRCGRERAPSSSTSLKCQRAPRQQSKRLVEKTGKKYEKHNNNKTQKTDGRCTEEEIGGGESPTRWGKSDHPGRACWWLCDQLMGTMKAIVGKSSHQTRPAPRGAFSS